MDWFSYLKLRGSWGKLGNERIGAYDDDGNFIYNYYPYQAAIDYSTALFQNSQGIVSSVTTAEVCRTRYFMGNNRKLGYRFRC